MKKMLAPDGTWMIVKPLANDRVEDKLNPVGRVFYAASTMICVPVSLAYNGSALGAQTGEARLQDVVRKGGIRRFRRATRRHSICCWKPDTEPGGLAITTVDSAGPGRSEIPR